MSMPTVSVTSTSSSNNSNKNAVQHRSRLLRLQDRRFRHRFPQVPADDKLLNYFSCALVSDILLQGHLFITKNYFAFYSNIFGHKTQLLINVADVVKVTKEKIAKFIPNAVGVYTETEKFVFGSMLSRDSAFRVIQQTWIQSTDPGVGLPDDSDSEVSPAIMLGDEDSSVGSGVSGHTTLDEVLLSSDVATTPEMIATPTRSLTDEEMRTVPSAPPSAPPSVPPSAPPSAPPSPQKFAPVCRHNSVIIPLFNFNFLKEYIIKVDTVIKELRQLSRTSLLFMMSTILLIILFISTTILLYRIHLLHQKLLAKDDFYESSIPSFSDFPNMVQSDFASVVLSLEERLKSLAEVRTTLEKLLAMANKFQEVPRYSQPIT